MPQKHNPKNATEQKQETPVKQEQKDVSEAKAADHVKNEKKEEKSSQPSQAPNDLQAQIEALQAQVSILTKAASKSRLARHTHEEKSDAMSVRVGLYRSRANEEPSLITSWQMIRDVVDYRRKNDIEEQIVEITLDNKEVVELDLRDFVHSIERLSVDLDMEKTTFNRDGSLQNAVFIYNGKEKTLSSQFINP